MELNVQISTRWLWALVLCHVWQGTILIHGATAADPVAYFVFGDSLVDTGNNNYLATTARADFLPYGIDYLNSTPTGRFSNGFNIADFISKKLGAEPVLPWLDPNLDGNALLRGANFASAGVGVLNDTGVQFANILRMPRQLDYFARYQQRVSSIMGVNATAKLVANALISVALGGNDYINNYYVIPRSPRSQQLNIQEFTDLVVSEYKKYLTRLYDLGGRRILVTSAGPMGCAPGVKTSRSSNNGECVQEIQNASQLFNAGLQSIISQLNSQLRSTIYTLGNTDLDIFHNPQSNGFANGRDACCGQGRFNGAGLCTQLSSLCQNRSEYVFWDNYHPTERANSLIVDRLFQGSQSDISPVNLSQLLRLSP